MGSENLTGDHYEAITIFLRNKETLDSTVEPHLISPLALAADKLNSHVLSRLIRSKADCNRKTCEELFSHKDSSNGDLYKRCLCTLFSAKSIPPNVVAYDQQTNPSPLEIALNDKDNRTLDLYQDS